jgi:hypothetical protein
MSQDTDEGGEETDLTEEQEADSKTLGKVRKNLKSEKAANAALLEEVEAFRTARSQSRAQAIEALVNDAGYPQAVVDSLQAKVQDADEDEYLAILADLQPAEAEGDEGASGETVQDEKVLTPAEIGQQLAAAGATGKAVNPLDRINAAQSPDEVNAIAKELGLDNP